MAISSIQSGQSSFQFVNGFGIINSPYYPNTQLAIFYGDTLDSSYTYQLEMPNATVLLIDSTVSGIGGLDKGSLSPNKVYGLYVAWDPVGRNAPSAFMSSSYYHPTIPYGYDAVKLIGYAATDSSGYFRPAVWNKYGSAAYRNFIYTPNVAILENGTAAIQTDVNLISYIPNIDGQIVNLELSFTSTTPGNCLTIYSEMSDYKLYAQVSGVPNTSLNNIMPTKQTLILDIVSPIIGYSVTNGATDSASIYCNGYDFFL